MSVTRSYTRLHELLLVSALHLVELQLLILQLDLRSILISLSSPTENHIDPNPEEAQISPPPKKELPDGI